MNKWVLLLFAVALKRSQPALINIVQGSLRGIPRDGYISYAGIPYASFRGREHRFKTAGLAPSWFGLRESQQSGCSSFNTGPEDCSLVDVHVPTTAGGPWPVLAWVSGVGRNYNPTKITQQGVIVVVIHHRVLVEGFLCLGDENIPGNAGAKDIILALRWVRDNIAAFLGNPSRVVLAGQGFGAALAESLMLSPMAEGLFHAVILQSGTVLAPWSFNYDAKARAFRLAEKFSDNENITEVFFRESIDDLVARAKTLDVPYFPFGICADKALETEEVLLSEPPIALFSKKRAINVPILMGYNTDEAYIFISKIIESRLLRKAERDPSVLIPEELHFPNLREMETFVRQMRSLYFENNMSTAALLEYYRDAYFLSHIHRSVLFHASSNSHVYYYQFSYAGDAGVATEPELKKKGAAHSDELAYLFGEEWSGEDGKMQEQLLRIWSNFVKLSEPSPSGQDAPWSPVTLPSPRVMDIGAVSSMKEFPRRRQLSWWNNVYDNCYFNKHSNLNLS